jgi:RNA polymerase sigma-70 factor (ECF subfamily)
MESEHFAQMVAALRLGDASAVQALLKGYEPYIRRVVRMRLHDTNLVRLFDSMDICQSILTSFLVHAADGDFRLGSPEDLRNLLVRMALNKLATRARALQREAGNLPDDWDEIDPSPTPLDRLVTADLAGAVRDRLTPEERALFDLHAVERLSWEEIARRHGGSADALRIRLTRAFARVRKELAPEA